MEERHQGYLTRLGVEGTPRPGAETLRALQLRHLLEVPFENLSIHLGEEIVLEETALVDKIVHRHRGGFCYELNGAFASLLTALGFPVTMLEARVTGGGGLGPPYDHMVLRVDLEVPWLTDVGFGKFSHNPLRLDARDDQADPGGTFRISENADGDLDVVMDGEPQYRVDQRPRTLSDFEATCWWHRTSPKSHFTQSVVCSRLSEDGRLTLSGRTLIETAGAERRERELADDGEVLEAYRTRFGIALDRVPVAGRFGG